jgi:hypothetical protein
LYNTKQNLQHCQKYDNGSKAVSRQSRGAK